MIDTTNVNSIFDAKAIDPSGDKVGTVKQVYVDQTSGQPLFASISTGLFGTSESFVPLEGATITGDELRLGYDKDQIKDAPRIDADGDLSDAEQDRLFDHYGLGGGTTSSSTGSTDDGVVGGAAGYGTASDVDGATTGTTSGTDADLVGSGTTASAGHDTSGPDTDDAMTRSEERLQVGTERVAAGRARLRKHIVTEQQTVTVPVQHEEVRLETEPITDANVGAATDGPALSEEEHEVTLNAEHVVVDKETVPVERVRLGTETVTEQQQVSEDVAHEEIDLDEDGTNRR
ncbi:MULTISPECIES: YsnF/AvaK domain-containing protein [unclassified Curtobacterium]|uniref:YsnF/AvaK domain-containing protein n=1 Tax=unclassified Curtobacterium TaxID=257496 RepID=UPI00226B6032|nr:MULTISPECIES: YsnF/AvaK domain-containing protein [unclassified Curtobacterium]